MQRDFLQSGGFGEALGNDVSRLRVAVQPIQQVLAAARKAGLLVIHTREGHRPDLTDAPPLKVDRGDPKTRIGALGPMGRILVRGEPGHDIIPELYPAPGEPIVDKPGKGAFYQTDLELMLKNRGIDTLLVCGVTTEVCVNTTVREANDRGFRCLVLSDCCASYFPEFHQAGLDMIKAQGGIFGSVSASTAVITALSLKSNGACM
jgi:nicotinamidase-related amidase